MSTAVCQAGAGGFAVVQRHGWEKKSNGGGSGGKEGCKRQEGWRGTKHGERML